MLTLHQAGLTTTPAIAPLDGTIRPGELLAIVGPNGAGKSTLLSMLSGFRPAEQGELHLDGTPLREWPIAELANRRALVAQQELPGFDWQTDELLSLGFVRKVGERRSGKAKNGEKAEFTGCK